MAKLRRMQTVDNSEALAVILLRRLCPYDGTDSELQLHMVAFQLQDSLREAGLTLIKGKFTNK